MAFSDWIAKLIFGPPPAKQPVRIYDGQGICPYCGVSLPTIHANQCFACGVDWHDPQNVFQRGTPGTPPRAVTSAVAAAAIASAASPTPRAPQTPSQPSTREPKPPPPFAADGLELGALAPMSHADVRAEANAAGNTLFTAFFGRIDLIPPITDKRTELIDRGMLGQGFITAEELAEIHRVGLEMDRIRPDIVEASRIASQAVADSVAEREARKAQKKAESAERKRLHAEAVTTRRATDIVFLGRGVSRGLADRRANIERLQAAGLPVLATPADVAKALGIGIPQLRWLAFHTEAATRTHYITFSVPKRSGGQRRLAAPHRRLARCQLWILQNILEKVPTHDAAHGFVRGRSIATNAAAHVGKEIVVNADLQDFFPTIEFSRVKGAFRALGYSPAVATILALLCTEAPRRQVQYNGKTYAVATGPRALPQGACTSPALSNLVSRRLDQRLSSISAKLGWTYTRYADDLTFSANDLTQRNIGYLLARLRHIAQEEGFVVHEKKTRVQRQSTRQTVTGVVVNDRPGVPREVVRRIRSILHRAKREGLHSQNHENRPHFDSWLLGMIAYISMLQPDQGRKLRAAYDELHPSLG